MALRLIQDGDTAAAADINQYLDPVTNLSGFNAITLIADGVTDQSAVLQAALDGLGYGATLSIRTSDPNGAIAIAAPVVVPKMGIRIVGMSSGVGNQGLKFVATADLSVGRGSMFTWLPTAYTNINEGCGAENFNVDMNGFAGHGITVCRGYNNSTFRNIRVFDVADAYSAWRFMRHLDHPGGASSVVSQSILCENIQGVHLNNTATAPTILLDSVQESIFIGCKAWAGAGTVSACPAPAWTVRDSRSVQFYGCSAVATRSAGWRIESVDRQSDSIAINDPTFELVGGDPFTANSSTNVVSLSAAPSTMGISNGQIIRFVSLGTTTGVSTGTTYYARQVSGYGFKVATTDSDATIVTITASGSGIIAYDAPTVASNPYGDTKLVQAYGNATYTVSGVSCRNPRHQYPVYAHYRMTYSSYSTVETGTCPVVVDSTSSFVRIVTSRQDLADLGSGSGNALVGYPLYVAGKPYTMEFLPSISTPKAYIGAGTDSASYSGVFVTSGTGSPEGVVTAPIGSIFLRTDGGATTTFYVKTSGTGNTGWTAK